MFDKITQLILVTTMLGCSLKTALDFFEDAPWIVRGSILGSMVYGYLLFIKSIFTQ